MVITLFGLRREKTCLISTFVIRSLESIISRLATGSISIFHLVFVAEGTGLSLALLETPKTGFVVTRPIYDMTLSYPLNNSKVLR